MKVSRTTATANRAHVVAVAGRRFRASGVDGVGVAALMHEAGFTHGGFYNHFASKQALAAEVVATTFDAALAALIDTLSGDADVAGSPLLNYIRHYLSRQHRDALCDGCPTATLATDAARHGVGLQTAYADGLLAMVNTLTEHIARSIGPTPQGVAPHAGPARIGALRLLAELAGALLLARAVGAANPALADDILDASCRGLTGTPLAASVLPRRPTPASPTRRRGDGAG